MKFKETCIWQEGKRWHKLNDQVKLNFPPNNMHIIFSCDKILENGWGWEFREQFDCFGQIGPEYQSKYFALLEEHEKKVNGWISTIQETLEDIQSKINLYQYCERAWLDYYQVKSKLEIELKKLELLDVKNSEFDKCRAMCIKEKLKYLQQIHKNILSQKVEEDTVKAKILNLHQALKEQDGIQSRLKCLRLEYTYVQRLYQHKEELISYLEKMQHALNYQEITVYRKLLLKYVLFIQKMSQESYTIISILHPTEIDTLITGGIHEIIRRTLLPLYPSIAEEKMMNILKKEWDLHGDMYLVVDNVYHFISIYYQGKIRVEREREKVGKQTRKDALLEYYQQEQKINTDIQSKFEYLLDQKIKSELNYSCLLSLLEDHAENYLEIKPVLDHIGEDVVTAMIQEQEKNYDQCMMELDGQLAEKRDQKEKWEMNLAFEMQIKKALEIMKSVAFSKKSFSHSCYRKQEEQLWDYITKRIKENLAKTQLM